MRELKDRMDRVRAGIEERLDVDQEWQLFEAQRLEREQGHPTENEPGGEATVIPLVTGPPPRPPGASEGDDEPLNGPGPTPLKRASRWAHDHQPALWVAAAVTVALFVGSVVLFGGPKKTDDEFVIDGTSPPTAQPSTTGEIPGTRPQVEVTIPTRPAPAPSTSTTVTSTTTTTTPSTTTTTTTAKTTSTTTTQPTAPAPAEVPSDPGPNTTTTTIGGPVDDPIPDPGYVNYADPPRNIELYPLGSVPSQSTPSVAIGDLGVAVQPPITDNPTGAITVFGFDGTVREVPIKEAPTLLAYGPGDVAYVDRAGIVAAVPLSGSMQGVFFDAPVEGGGSAAQLRAISTGHGEAGLIDRRSYRSTGTTLIDYVDVTGRPTSLAGAPLTAPWIKSQSKADVRIGGDNDIDWNLSIDRSPNWKNWWPIGHDENVISHDPPAPAVSGNNVFWTQIGPWSSSEPATGRPTQWVIAQLFPFGYVQWWSVPDGWQVVASDVWGTVVARQTSQGTEIAIAQMAVVAASN